MKENKLNTITSTIEDLSEELHVNLVSPSRHKEIIKLFENVLGKGPYYTVSVNNPAFNAFEFMLWRELTESEKEISAKQLKKPFNFTTRRGPLTYLEGCVVKYYDKRVKAIWQTIKPKNTFELYHMDEYEVLYFDKETIDKLKG